MSNDYDVTIIQDGKTVQFDSREWESIVAQVEAQKMEGQTAEQTEFIDQSKEEINLAYDKFNAAQKEIDFMDKGEQLTDIIKNGQMSEKDKDKLIAEMYDMVKQMMEERNNRLSVKVKENIGNAARMVRDSYMQFTGKTKEELQKFMGQCVDHGHEVADNVRTYIKESKEFIKEDVKSERDTFLIRAQKKLCQQKIKFREKELTHCTEKMKTIKEFQKNIEKIGERTSSIKQGFKNLGRAFKGLSPVDEKTTGKLTQAMMAFAEKTEKDIQDNIKDLNDQISKLKYEEQELVAPMAEKETIIEGSVADTINEVQKEQEELENESQLQEKDLEEER